MTVPTSTPARRGIVARRHPVAKLVAALLIALPLVVTIDPVSAGVALALEVPLLLSAGLTPRQFWLRTLPLWIAAPAAAVTISLYGQSSGRVLVEWLFVHVSEGSILLGLSAMLRVLAIGLPAVVLFVTVDPTDLADGLAQVLRLPARFVLGGLAGMRMLGLLAEDWRALALARRARGVADAGRVRRVAGMAFALLVLAIRRGSALATAMEARAFGAPGPRTWARPSRLVRADVVLIVAALAIPAIALAAAVATGSFRPVFGAG
ncbi:energy-coupling factor transporter transmembrane component T family protein [Microbacterium sp. TNHR37B]|uniref:energy-coupling factor transporter transmembrane component T family protein n=1 Tax=Microbacterium sp. TNHR37B TaxID=1775956 RepID=UPI0007B2DA2D|nr:energy-coupling factor transporter transmembrane component T [Microbacterium sp. TNHR37B]KZE88463.1 putative HMP/thiamine permease protein YkoC [Microbacterium sp. TNHR37B]